MPGASLTVFVCGLLSDGFVWRVSHAPTRTFSPLSCVRIAPSEGCLGISCSVEHHGNAQAASCQDREVEKSRTRKKGKEIFVCL
jgi:hypothetical protein